MFPHIQKAIIFHLKIVELSKLEGTLCLSQSKSWFNFELKKDVQLSLHVVNTVGFVLQWKLAQLENRLTHFLCTIALTLTVLWCSILRPGEYALLVSQWDMSAESGSKKTRASSGGYT